MKITVNRFVSDGDTTLSEISFDGKFECFGLEDEYRLEKVASETRIPAGVYVIGLRTWGGFHAKYSRHPSYSAIHKGMLEVMDVPNFTGILIHVGNTDDDTAGCLLVGLIANSQEGNISIGNSRVAYIKFYKKVLVAIENDEQVTIEYVDND